ncbi:MAG: molybdopterin molybdotransferase MoeA [Actinomycetota bacterium]|nr:molybdopterin molybdotransferase MoeA [Actinomycetota bacterium]
MTETMTVEEARELLLARIERMPVERVELLACMGRVLAEDAVSDIDVAPFDNSAMDGFAVRAADLAGASAEAPVALSVISHIGAGDWSETPVGPGEAARIMTGAPVPPGADSVVMVERTEVVTGDGGIGSQVAFAIEPAMGEHIRKRAEEVRAGAVVISAGEMLGSAAVGLLASTGHAQVAVYRRPRVAIVSTGSELVEVAETPGPGKIRNSNSYSIAAQVIAAGGVPLRFPIVPDDLDATREAFLRAARESDFIVTSGGVSVGDFDYVKPVLEELGELTYCKVKMRPGNPQTMGSISGVPFFGLPGNPTSTYVGFEIFVRPALRKMQGFTALDRPIVEATLAHDVKKKQDRRYYLRARLSTGNDGMSVAISGSQSSALLTAAHQGNCFMVLPEGDGLFPTGTPVACMRLDIDEGIPL